VAPRGPRNFADADFLGTAGGAGGAEVHEVDTGDQEDEGGDDGKNIDVGDTAVGLDLAIQVGVQVDIGDCHNGVSEMVTRLRQLIEGDVKLLLDHAAYVGIGRPGDVFLDFRGGGARLDQDIGIEVIGEPGVIIGSKRGIAEWQDKTEVEMGLFGHVTDDSGDLAEGIVVAYFEGAADNISAVEVAAGGAFVDDDGMGIIEGAIGVAGDKWEREDFEDCAVRKDLMMVEDVVVPFFDQDVARAVEPDHLLEFGVGSGEGGPEEFRRMGIVDGGVTDVGVDADAIDAVGVDVVTVVTELIGDVQDDEETYGEAGSEADDVEGGEAFGSAEVAKGYFEIVAEHGVIFVQRLAAKRKPNWQEIEGQLFG